MQRVRTVKHADVFRLYRGQSAHSPGQIYVVRFYRLLEWVHAAMFGKAVSFSRVARRTCRDHIGPHVRSAPGNRYQVIARQALAGSELIRAPPAVLAAIAVTRKQERVCNLPAELAGYKHKSDKANHGGFWDGESGTPDDPATIAFNDLSLAIEHQSKRTPHGYERERFE